MTIPDLYLSRLAALREEMRKRDLPAMFVSRPENRMYLSGYTAHDSQLDESSGYLLITPRHQFLLTDFRYKIQAQQEAPGFEVYIYSAHFTKTLVGLANRFRFKRMGFEEDVLSVKSYRLIENELKVELVPAAGFVENQRVSKDKNELRLIRRALGVTESALEKTFARLKAGQTEIEVARFLENTMLELGADEPAFPSIVASGPNAALPHATPSRRKIKEGETIIFDCGAKVRGYASDISRTIVLGRPQSWIMDIYQVVRRAQLRAIEALTPGLRSDQADGLARDVIEEAGYGKHFGHGLGHGVGLATHEGPYLSRNQRTALEPGMVFTIEPGIYLEGRGGVRLEEMAVITPEGKQVLNKDRTFYEWT